MLVDRQANEMWWVQIPLLELQNFAFVGIKIKNEIPG